MIAWFGPGWITFYEEGKKDHFRRRKPGIETSTALRESYWEITTFGLEMFIELPGDSNRFLSGLSEQKSGRGSRAAAVHSIRKNRKKKKNKNNIRIIHTKPQFPSHTTPPSSSDPHSLSPCVESVSPYP